MKKALFVLVLTSLFTCSRDNLSEVLQNDGSGVIKLSVKLDQSFAGGTGADSPWVHPYQESAEVTFTSTTTAFTKTVTFNPNDLANFPATSLPYGDYNWTVAQSGSDVAVSSVLYVFGSSATPFTVDAPTVTMPLVLETDFALVTVAADALSSASIRYNGVNTSLTTKDGYFYGYINSNFSGYTLNVVTTDNLGGADSILTPIASTHYNYAITYQLFGATGVSVELADTFVLEDRDILTGLDEDFDGVLDTEDLCPGTRSGAPVDANGCLDVIELDANGVTIKAKPGAANGDQQELNGVTYTVVDEATLRTMVANDEDVTTVVTTLVTNMAYMFQANSTFNQNISSWDVGNVTTMEGMFWGANQFNQQIGDWDVSNVTNMTRMLSITSFNQPIGNWNVSKVESIAYMFSNSPFNQPLNNWNTISVTDMSAAFDSSPFNQDINNWNVSNVLNMEFMFNASDFNSNISDWDVSTVTNMSRMFQDSVFNLDLSGWDVNQVSNCTNFSFNANSWTLPKPNFTNCTE